MLRGRWAVLALLLAGCGAPAVTSADMQVMHAAPEPLNRDAAEAAIKRYFDRTLYDGESARWRFTHAPIRNVLTFGPLIGGQPWAGWFSCGEVNAKNRMGGYTGWHRFIAHFSPTNPYIVANGLMDDGRPPHFAEEMCNKVYGAAG